MLQYQTLHQLKLCRDISSECFSSFNTLPMPEQFGLPNYRVLSIAASKGQPEENGVAIATEQAWDHVQSLYQHSSSMCLFGKNNILVKPVSLAEPDDNLS